MKKKYLQTMGIEVWQQKKGKVTKKQTKSVSSTNSVQQMDWEELEKTVAACTLCGLCKSRTHTVFGVGNKKAKIMFIGEAPGANEDLQGEPFVGRAGMLLTAMLQSIGLQRSDVYIANILKCRPPNNRDPQPEEEKVCTPYLQRQIALIKPQFLVAVGRIAAQFLLQTTETMARLRGQTFTYGEQKTPLFVTYHPAYLLRSPREKSKAYLDFKEIKRRIKV
jgi:uracil-DNA glycosylase